MTKRIAILTVLLAAVVASSGCVSLGNYFSDRALDFIDCFKADVGYGVGLDVHLVVTNSFSPGIGVSDMKKYGFKGRYFGTWRDVHYGFPVSGFMHYKREGHNKELGLLYMSSAFIGCRKYTRFGYAWYIPGGYHSESSVLFGLSALFEKEIDYNYGSETKNDFEDLVSSFDIELGASIGFVGFRVGFSPGQFVDFLLGWFGIDIAEDDPLHLPEDREEPAKGKESG